MCPDKTGNDVCATQKPGASMQTRNGATPTEKHKGVQKTSRAKSLGLTNYL